MNEVILLRSLEPRNGAPALRGNGLTAVRTENLTIDGVRAFCRAAVTAYDAQKAERARVERLTAPVRATGQALQRETARLGFSLETETATRVAVAVITAYLAHGTEVA